MEMDSIITPRTIEGSWIYTSYIAAALLESKVYPYKINMRDGSKFKIWNATEDDVSTRSLTVNLLDDYKKLINRFDSIIIGPPNGGIVYLAMCLKSLYLPSHLFLPFRINCDPDSLEHHIAEGWERNKHILQKEEMIENVMHFDPIHDRVDIGRMIHNRIKFLSLPDEYKTFIGEKLKDGGTVINIQVDFHWPQFEISNRLFMQLGGFGGIPPEEYIHGSERINKWLETQWTRHRGGWGNVGYSTINKPESEWGSLPRFYESVVKFCESNGYNLLNLTFDHPFKLGVLTSMLMNDMNNKEGKIPEGIILETYWTMSPEVVRKSNYLPIWIPYVDITSYQKCQKYLEYLSQYNPRLFKNIILGYTWALPTLDIKSPEEWITMLSSFIPRKNIWLPGVSQLNNPMSADVIRYIDIMNAWLNESMSPSTSNRVYSIEDVEKVYDRINNQCLL